MAYRTHIATGADDTCHGTERFFMDKGYYGVRSSFCHLYEQEGDEPDDAIKYYT